MLNIKKRLKITAAILLMASPFTSHATVVTVYTSLGDIEINLFDEITPKTVENFLQYVESGAFANTIVHRSVDGFIVQSGSYVYTGAIEPSIGINDSVDSVVKGIAVENEPKLSNLRGTVAMAKLSGDPNSATSGWFFNLSNNASNLDEQNGGFTVFGQVIGDGMDVVDEISNQTTANFGGGFTNTPIRDYTQDDLDAGVDITDDNLVIITDIVVTDSTVVTNPDLNPTENTLINASSGGALGWLMLVAALGFVRYFKRAN